MSSIQRIGHDSSCPISSRMREFVVHFFVYLMGATADTATRPYDFVDVNLSWLLEVWPCGMGCEVMAVPAGKTRLNITLPDEVVALVDNEARRTGGTRSSVLASCVLDALDVQTVTPEQMIRLMQDVMMSRDK